MKWNRTKAFLRRVVGKKTPNGLRVNARGETPNGTKVKSINNSGKPTTTSPQWKQNNLNRNMGRPPGRGPLTGGAWEMI